MAALSVAGGHRGETFGCYTESWTAENDGRQLTVATTPWGTAKPKVPGTELCTADVVLAVH